MNTAWLALNEYSQRYKVSISTLRRRIKKNQVRFKYLNGKYFLSNEELIVRQNPYKKLDAPQEESSKKESISSFKKNESSVLIVANNLLRELKQTYSFSLNEKEKVILKLQSQNSNLETLVKVLESRFKALEEDNALSLNHNYKRKNEHEEAKKSSDPFPKEDSSLEDLAWMD